MDKNSNGKLLSFYAAFGNFKISFKSAMAWFDIFPLAATDQQEQRQQQEVNTVAVAQTVACHYYIPFFRP
ncbi:hypothetical protein QQ020_13285 [Fulvivirgaceae bacterium BMA12]|uniref:Uncharacterized protein n=1 Tax=Agaribacillus aureus TaxID=3051825 RepID=A0ABT8L5M5_9BACT|nr:hypothetical protein [Fulvivirgaceae bacterium BMA12]